MKIQKLYISIIFLFFTQVELVIISKDRNSSLQPLTRSLKSISNIKRFENILNASALARKLVSPETERNLGQSKIKLSNTKINQIMKILRIKDKEFYQKLKKLRPHNRKLYLLGNRERLLVSLGQEITRTGVFGRGDRNLFLSDLIEKFTGGDQVKALMKAVMKRKEELYLSRIAKRKDIQEIEFAITNLQGQVYALGDHTFSKSFELQNAIESKLGY